MSTVTNSQLAEQLGDVREKIGALLADQKHASQGRNVLHDKLDRLLDAVQTQAVAVAEASKDAALASSTAAQTRDRLDAFDREFKPAIQDLKSDVDDLKKADADAAPLLGTVRQVRTIGVVIIAISGTGVLSVGAVFSFFNDSARLLVLNWLGLS